MLTQCVRYLIGLSPPFLILFVLHNSLVYVLQNFYLFTPMYDVLRHISLSISAQSSTIVICALRNPRMSTLISKLSRTVLIESIILVTDTLVIKDAHLMWVIYILVYYTGKYGFLHRPNFNTLYKLEKYMKAPTHYIRYLEHIFANSPISELAITNRSDFVYMQHGSWFCMKPDFDLIK